MWCPVCGHAVIPSKKDVLYCTSSAKHALTHNVYGALVSVVPAEVLVEQPADSEPEVLDAAEEMPAPEVEPTPAPIKTEIPPAPQVKPIAKKGAK